MQSNHPFPSIRPLLRLPPLRFPPPFQEATWLRPIHSSAGAPEVALMGEETLEWEMGVLFVDPGFTATDFSGADIAPSTKLTNPPDVSTPGTYKLIYASNDFRGFEGSATRTVKVVATPPTITLNPGSEAGPDGIDPTGEVVYHSVQRRNLNFSKIADFQDPGFTAHDFADRNLEPFVQTVGLPVAHDEKGIFSLTYTVNDQYRNGTLPGGIPVSTTVTP